jgi:hypothetical protein
VKRSAVVFALLLGCSGRPDRARDGEVRISEVVTSNLGGGPGAARDELGEYDDWIELENLTDRELDLAGMWISDAAGNPQRWTVPDEEAVPIAPKGFALIFADGETHQGPLHLPFKLSSEGEPLLVATSTGTPIDRIDAPLLRAGQSYARIDGAFAVCDTPTPGTSNACTKQPPVKTEYQPYDWPEIWPAPIASSVVISEIDPGADWIELENRSDAAVDLSTLQLAFGSTSAPSLPPLTNRVPMSGSLAPHAQIAFDAPELGASARVVLFGPGGAFWDLEQYDAIEPGTVLALPPDGRGLRLACSNSSRGAANEACVFATRSSRPLVISAIRSPADFDAIAEHGDERTAGARSVKFVIDRQANDRVYFFESEKWELHFDWIWETIEHREPFDLCDPASKTQHDQAWGAFSNINYFAVESRRFYLGTILFYPESNLYTLEFAAGDRIAPWMMREAFFLVAAKIHDGREYSIRPTTTRQEASVLDIEGTVPIVPVDDPFEGITFQPLNPGVAYGVLEVVKTEELGTAPVSFQTIAILDEIPNDVPPLGGTITEAFQTPLAHVNVLAQNRGTPNMALANASTDPRLLPYLGELVRLEVESTGFDIRVATSSEAEEFWRLRREQTGTFVPEQDLSQRAIVDLSTAGFADIPVIGAKASQYAELINLDWASAAGGMNGACAFTQVGAQLPMQRPAFAIPFARYRDHIQANGIEPMIDDLLADEEALANPVLRREKLTAIQTAIREAPVDPELLAELGSLLGTHFGTERVRFRSSTNVEDLAGFNGAGLYESGSAQLGSEVRKPEDTLRTVWASAWSFRGFEERALFGVDQHTVNMGVLIHHGYPSEEANGVAISKNVVDPGGFGYYINAQVGEISVVNPESGDLPEQIIYKPYNPPEVVVLGRSTAAGGAPVLLDTEVYRLGCMLQAVHSRFLQHYRDRIPQERFAVDVEWKIDGATREVFLKQARPWIERRSPPNNCR